MFNLEVQHKYSTFTAKSVSVVLCKDILFHHIGRVVKHLRKGEGEEVESIQFTSKLVLGVVSPRHKVSQGERDEL